MYFKTFREHVFQISWLQRDKKVLVFHYHVLATPVTAVHTSAVEVCEGRQTVPPS
jgi:hypothetical protein